MVKLKCLNCGITMEVPRYLKDRKKYCSKKCMNQYRIGKTTKSKGRKFSNEEYPNMGFRGGYYKKIGKDHPNWKGGRYINSKGYVQILDKGHPKRNVCSYIGEHILIMEKHLGRYLNYYGINNQNNEVVHHINENKQDNRIENLQLMTNREHSLLHLHKRWQQIRTTSVSNDNRRKISVIKNLLPNKEELSIIQLFPNKALGSCIHSKLEYFAVIEGELYVVGAEEKKIYKTGDSGKIPIESPHLFYSLTPCVVIEWGVEEKDKFRQYQPMKNVITKINNKIKNKLSPNDIDLMLKEEYKKYNKDKINNE